MIDIDLLKSYFENDDQPDEGQFAALIEACFNANGGWVEVPDGTASYSSATQMLFTDADLFIGVGDQVRYKQGAGYKFGLVTAVSETTVELDGGAEFALTNSTITAMAFAKAGGVGFPEALKYLTAWPAGLGRYANTETLSANKALVDADNPIQFLDPSASVYTVTLPAEGEINHPYYLVNTGSHYLQVDDDGEVTLITVDPGKAALVLSDGASWQVIATTNAAAPATKILESGGPTVLTVGAIPDGAFLRRSGTGMEGTTDVAGKTQKKGGSVFFETPSINDGAYEFVIPPAMDGWNLTWVRSKAGTGPSGGPVTIQFRKGLTDMLSTALTIDNGDDDSIDAAAQPVIDTANDDVATGDTVSIDFDAVNDSENVSVAFEFTGEVD